MKALVKLKKERGLWLQDVPAPEAGPEDVLIKVERSAICGTDLHIYNWDDWAQRTIPVPMTVGHEFVGRVAAVGREVSGLAPGDRVSGEGHITCGHCRNCRAGRQHFCRNTVGVGVNRPGSFAEYIAIPARNAYPIPADLPDDVAATLDPLGNAAHTALSYDLVGEDVLVAGAGPIGLMAAAIARHVGARHVVVTDVNDYRLGLAGRVGATRAVNVRTTDLRAVMDALGMTEGFDVGLEMSGSPDALRQMIDVMNNGGNLALLGIPPGQTAVDWSQVIFKGLKIKGIYGREMYDTWYKMIAMLQSGLDISPVLTHRFPVDAFEAGFAAMNEGRSGKVILSWS